MGLAGIPLKCSQYFKKHSSCVCLNGAWQAQETSHHCLLQCTVDSVGRLSTMAVPVAHVGLV